MAEEKTKDEKAKPVAEPAPAATTETTADAVYQITLADGQIHAWHGSTDDLKTAHPDAVITGQLVMDDVGQGSWAPYSAPKAAPKAKTTNAKEEKSEKDSETDSDE